MNEDEFPVFLDKPRIPPCFPLNDVAEKEIDGFEMQIRGVWPGQIVPRTHVANVPSHLDQLLVCSDPQCSCSAHGLLQLDNVRQRFRVQDIDRPLDLLITPHSANPIASIFDQL